MWKYRALVSDMDQRRTLPRADSFGRDLLQITAENSEYINLVTILYIEWIIKSTIRCIVHPTKPYFALDSALVEKTGQNGQNAGTDCRYLTHGGEGGDILGGAGRGLQDILQK